MSKKRAVGGYKKIVDEFVEKYYNVAIQKISKINRERAAQRREARKALYAKKYYNPDKHCGVRNSKDIPCIRVVACDLHKIAQKRAVLGRNEDISVLIKNYKLERQNRPAKLKIPTNAGQVVYHPIKMILPKIRNNSTATTSSQPNQVPQVENSTAITSSQNNPEPKERQNNTTATISSQPNPLLEEVQSANKGVFTPTKRVTRSVTAKLLAASAASASSVSAPQVPQIERGTSILKKALQRRPVVAGPKPASTILKPKIITKRRKKLKNSIIAKRSSPVSIGNNCPLEQSVGPSKSGIENTKDLQIPEFSVEEVGVQELTPPAIAAEPVPQETNLDELMMDQEAVLHKLPYPALHQEANMEQLPFPILDPKASLQELPFQMTTPETNHNYLLPEAPIEDSAFGEYFSELMEYCYGTGWEHELFKLLYKIQQPALAEKSTNLNIDEHTAGNTPLPPVPAEDVAEYSGSYQEVPLPPVPAEDVTEYSGSYQEVPFSPVPAEDVTESSGSYQEVPNAESYQLLAEAVMQSSSELELPLSPEDMAIYSDLKNYFSLPFDETHVTDSMHASIISSIIEAIFSSDDQEEDYNFPPTDVFENEVASDGPQATEDDN